MSFTKLLRNSLLWLTLAGTLAILTGCASESGPGGTSYGDGTIPWNRPAKWEGPGVMGSSMQGTP